VIFILALIISGCAYGGSATCSGEKVEGESKTIATNGITVHAEGGKCK
jgi:hypothetical protein